MVVREIGDPRLEALFGTGEPREIGARPVVRLRRGGTPGRVIGLVAAFAAVLLFVVLSSSRTAQPQPSLREAPAAARQFAPEPPPLYIPPTQPVAAPFYPQATAPASGPPVVLTPAPLRQPRQLAVPQAPPAFYAPQPEPQMLPPMPPPPARTAGGAALVIDKSAPAASAGPTAATAMPGLASSRAGARVRASALANRPDTVAQGVLIPAVLETAFDSTRAGFARAIVSRDVRGFDGSRILIPRGSRLVGEYQSEVAPGQKRALITWTRLVRPDGMMIALDSPATDTLGRGGVRASVNSHFMERFLGGLMRTTVDVGAGVATAAATGSVFVALPGAMPRAGAPTQSNRVMPTLSIPAGTSISIFVARDLEFAEGTSRQ